ncbi:MAG: glycosyltransferase family 4 protein [Propionibacteriaceae bacterium]|nr:glycosyltransferase family 4 protein [Propionibacteriaceae bacterium]
MTGLHSVSTYIHDMTVEHLLGGPDSAAGRRVVGATIPSFLASAEVPSGVRAEDHLDRLPHEPFILFVGALSKLKGLGVLFEAYRTLVAPPPLVLIGTPRPDALEYPAAAVVLTNVPHPAVMAAWDRAMFGVMPSLWPEPLGMVVAEGMSRGRPVIGTQTGGHRDMIDDASGILVPQGDVEALARAMQHLLDHPEKREAMGRAAQERAQLFTAESVLSRFERLYQDILAREGVVATS